MKVGGRGGVCGGGGEGRRKGGGVALRGRGARELAKNYCLAVFLFARAVMCRSAPCS